MAIKITPAKIMDQAEIDRFLEKSRSSVPYQRLQWFLAIYNAYGHEYIYLLARENKQIVGVLPVSVFKKLTGRKQLCSSPFCDVGGVVTDNDLAREKLIQYALTLADRDDALPLELRQRLPDQTTERDMKDCKVSMLLDLPDSSDTLLAGFKSKLRSQIKKAEKNGLVFDFANDAQSIGDFFYVFSRNMHALGSPTHSIKWFHELRKTYQEDMLVGRVWFEGKIVGAGILLFSGKNVSIPWASTLRDYNHLAPNMLLYWNLLRVSCERGCGQFDFGRSTFGEGTYKFKQQWGAKPVLLDWQYLDITGKAITPNGINKNKIRVIVETIWKKLPLSLVNILGPILRRHISL